MNLVSRISARHPPPSITGSLASTTAMEAQLSSAEIRVSSHASGVTVTQAIPSGILEAGLAQLTVVETRLLFSLHLYARRQARLPYLGAEGTCLVLRRSQAR